MERGPNHLRCDICERCHRLACCIWRNHQKHPAPEWCHGYLLRPVAGITVDFTHLFWFFFRPGMICVRFSSFCYPPSRHV